VVKDRASCTTGQELNSRFVYPLICLRVFRFSSFLTVSDCSGVLKYSVVTSTFFHIYILYIYIFYSSYHLTFDLCRKPGAKYYASHAEIIFVIRVWIKLKCTKTTFITISFHEIISSICDVTEMNLNDRVS
jgi:hypothetical protein